MARPRIVVRDLAKTFREDDREVAAVAGVSFEVMDGEFVALVGPSGCGKSTILNMIGGLVDPSGGGIAIDARPVAGTPPGVGYVFQKDTVFPWRTVARNIALGLEYRGIGGEERGRRVREAIALAGLEGFEDAFPATLSGGMRQRVALMRTLVVDPEILIMDEPFGALDTHTKINLHAELLRLWEGRRQTVVFVTHDLSEAITLADRIVVMTRRPGRVKLIHHAERARILAWQLGILTMMFGFGLAAKIVLAWTIVFFNTFQGARSVDADLIHSARFLGAGERQIMRTVIVPSALAWTFASLTPSISFALIGVVVGEFLGGESGGGLGYLIIQSLGTLNAADMMVALVTLGVIGIVMALGIKQIEMRLLRWRPEYRGRAR